MEVIKIFLRVEFMVILVIVLLFNFLLFVLIVLLFWVNVILIIGNGGFEGILISNVKLWFCNNMVVWLYFNYRNVKISFVNIFFL